MSETSFSITFSDSTTAVDCNYWIRLEVVKQEDDTVTLSEVADIVDAAFDVNVCGVEDPPAEEDPVSTEELIEGIDEPPQTVDFAALFQYIYGLSDYDPCKVNPATGKYEAQVRMYLSHPHDLEYKFIAENGEVLSTIITSESVDGNIEVNGNSITLEKPIASEVTASVTIKEILGSTVYFEEEIEDSVHFSYQSQHYLITVEVPASENFEETGEAGKCKCLGFFHGCVDEIILTPPEDDELTTELLGCDWGIGTETTPSVVTCYEAVTIREKCECSGSIASEEIVEMDIPCPEGSNYTCPHGYDTCRKLMGSRVEISYVDCGETTGDINTAEFYEENCCIPPPFALPKCSKVTRNYYGGKGIESGEALYRRLYGDNTRFIPVGPQNGVCGELIIEQRLFPLDCCDGVPPLIWDDINSAKVIADDSSGVVMVTEGCLPLIVSVRGSGFWLNTHHTIRDAIINSRSITVYTSDACGTAHLYITDGCSSVNGRVRSSDGQWVLVENDLPTCEVSAPDSAWSPCSFGNRCLDNGDFLYVNFITYHGGYSRCEPVGSLYPQCPTWFSNPPIDCVPWGGYQTMCVTDYDEVSLSNSFTNWAGTSIIYDCFFRFVGSTTDCDGGAGMFCGDMIFTAQLQKYEWVC